MVKQQQPNEDHPTIGDIHDNDKVLKSLEDYKDDSAILVTPKRFWRKLARFAAKAGQHVLEKALVLYYVSQSDHLPTRIKAIIFAGLGYFISTIDAIPDFTPLIGFTDDLGVLVAVVGIVASWISPDIQKKVDSKLSQYFSKNGEVIDQTDDQSNTPKQDASKT